MNMRHSVVIALVLVASHAIAQQTGNAGKYTGTMMGNGGREVPVQVTLAEAAGTWTMQAVGAGARKNPCMGKELPLEIVSGPDPLVLHVSGSKVIAGCMDGNVTLVPSGAGYKGTLADGREVTLTR